MRIALGIEYNGAPFYGWQSQSHLLAQGCQQTIQDILENALTKIACHLVQTITASRTDAKVHAIEQIVHFDTEAIRPLNAWVKGTNAHLPKTIRVIWAKEMSDSFHARHCVFKRDYHFLLWNHPIRPAIMADHWSWFHQPLDIEKIQESLSYFIGEQDFSSFRSAECQAKSPIKTCYNAQLFVKKNLLIFYFSANGFLHHQIRNMLGALIYIGKGKLQPKEIAELLKKKDRRQAPPTFSPQGLYLSKIYYDAKWGIPHETRYWEGYQI